MLHIHLKVELVVIVETLVHRLTSGFSFQFLNFQNVLESQAVEHATVTKISGRPDELNILVQISIVIDQLTGMYLSQYSQPDKVDFFCLSTMKAKYENCILNNEL